METMRRLSSLRTPGVVRREKSDDGPDDGSFSHKKFTNCWVGTENFDLSMSMDASFFWERKANSYRVVDLMKNHFDEALGFIKAYYFVSEPMCRATQLSKDNRSSWSYTSIIKTKMSDMHSMCALHEGTGRLVGVVVGRINLKADQIRSESRTRPRQGEALFKIMTLKSCVFARAHLYEKYGIDRYFRLHVLCVDPSYQSKGIGTALVRSCIAKTRVLNLPAIIGGFSSGAAQTIGCRLGFETLAEIPYKEFVSPIDDTKAFDDPGRGNHSIACMALLTPRPEPVVRLSSVKQKK